MTEQQIKALGDTLRNEVDKVTGANPVANIVANLFVIEAISFGMNFPIPKITPDLLRIVANSLEVLYKETVKDGAQKET